LTRRRRSQEKSGVLRVLAKKAEDKKKKSEEERRAEEEVRYVLAQHVQGSKRGAEQEQEPKSMSLMTKIQIP
jgi:hypothetical protein